MPRCVSPRRSSVLPGSMPAGPQVFKCRSDSASGVSGRHRFREAIPRLSVPDATYPDCGQPVENWHGPPGPQLVVPGPRRRPGAAPGSRRTASHRRRLVRRGDMTAGWTVRARARSAVSADGPPIGYSSLGDGPGLIVVGGSLGSRAEYFPLASALAHGCEVHVLDRRGRHGSGPQRPAPSIDEKCSGWVGSTGIRTARSAVTGGAPSP